MTQPRYNYNYSQDIVHLQTKYSLFKRVANILFSVSFEKGFEEPTIAVDAYPGIPNSIDVYVEGDLAYFHLRLKCNFIPSIEWLSSFGLTPYVEE
jgi:hypothetical protein